MEVVPNRPYDTMLSNVTNSPVKVLKHERMVELTGQSTIIIYMVDG